VLEVARPSLIRAPLARTHNHGAVEPTDWIAVAAIAMSVVLGVTAQLSRTLDRRAGQRAEDRRQAIDSVAKVRSVLARSAPAPFVAQPLTKALVKSHLTDLDLRWEAAEQPLNALAIAHHEAAVRRAAKSLADAVATHMTALRVHLDASVRRDKDLPALWQQSQTRYEQAVDRERDLMDVITSNRG
jgi:hypothetical protein